MVGTKNFVCPLDSRRFSTAQGLRDHKLAAHASSAPRRRTSKRGRSSASSDGGMTVSRRVLWDSVDGTSVYRLKFEPSALPPIRRLALIYESAVVVSAAVIYVPTVGTTTAGAITYGIDWNPQAKETVTDRESIASYSPSASHPVWERGAPMRLPRSKIMPKSRLNLSTSGEFDQVPFDLIYCSTVAKCGEFWVDLTIRFIGMRPVLASEPNPGPQPPPGPAPVGEIYILDKDTVRTFYQPFGGHHVYSDNRWQSTGWFKNIKPSVVEEQFSGSSSGLIGDNVIVPVGFDVSGHVTPVSATETLSIPDKVTTNQFRCITTFGIPISYVPNSGIVEVLLQVSVNTNELTWLSTDKGDFVLRISIRDYMDNLGQVFVRSMYPDVDLYSQKRVQLLLGAWKGVVRKSLPKVITVTIDFSVTRMGTPPETSFNGADLFFGGFLIIKYISDIVRVTNTQAQQGAPLPEDDTIEEDCFELVTTPG